MAHGGFLGFGETRSFVPVDAVTRVTEDRVFIDQSRERVTEAPVHDPELTDEPDYYSSVYGFYGCPPFWGAGYVHSPVSPSARRRGCRLSRGRGPALSSALSPCLTADGEP